MKLYSPLPFYVARFNQIISNSYIAINYVVLNGTEVSAFCSFYSHKYIFLAVSMAEVLPIILALCSMLLYAH